MPRSEIAARMPPDSGCRLLADAMRAMAASAAGERADAQPRQEIYRTIRRPRRAELRRVRHAMEVFCSSRAMPAPCQPPLRVRVRAAQVKKWHIVLMARAYGASRLPYAFQRRFAPSSRVLHAAAAAQAQKRGRCRVVMRQGIRSEVMPMFSGSSAARGIGMLQRRGR